jgi:hypothetical protein
MKVEIPENLKSDLPQTTFGKILSATPVVMAVVATMLAGLASSEMTRAQYDRSLGAQQQAKAGDQWSFFQAKRLRGALQLSSVELLENVVEVRPLDAAAIQGELAGTEAAKALATEAGKQALEALRKGEMPVAPTQADLAPEIKAAMQGYEALVPDSEMARLLANVTDESLEKAVKTARDQTQAFDAFTKPINQLIDMVDRAIAPQDAGKKALSRDFSAARSRYNASRYEIEARLNQAIANLYELQVRKSNISAARHHVRSQWFFFGMLGAQAGVIISTFAMAARNRNLLWSLAAGAGIVAIAFAIYVYLYM